MSRIDALGPHWDELSALLDEALALPASDRARWLATLGEAHAGVKDTLRELLAADAGLETRDFLGTLPRLGAAPPAALAEPAPGVAIGPYRLIRELGHGGMGAVWLAERADGVLAARQVALKLPRTAWGSALAERLARERDILASLEHPHIARLYDAGVDDHGRPYFAMEYVEGRPIDAYCRERAVALRERLGLLLQVCAAVAHAHSRLVVHRDLKPGNILVTNEGQVRLLDFGIAKVMQGERAEETALTREAGRALSLDYASPEQIRGEPLGTASDVYSLGVVAYELLTGQRPYRLKRGSAAELEEAIAHADPAPASEAASEPQLRRRLRGDLDAILNKALKKVSAERYASIELLAQDLRRHLQGEPVQARPDSRVYRARKFVQRHRWPVAAVSGVVLALAAGLGVALWQYRTATRNLGLAQLAFDRENAVRVMYSETLSTVAGWDAAAFAEPRSVPRLLQRKADELQQRFTDQPAAQIGLLHALAQQLPYMADHEGALAAGERYLALLKRSNPHPSHLMLAYIQRARTLSTLGRHAEGVAAMREAVATIANPQEAPAERVRMQVELGKMLSKTGDREAALAALREGLRLVVHTGTDSPAEARAELRQMLGRLHLGLDEPEALREMQASHEGFVQLPTVRLPQLGFSFWQLGIALLHMGQPREAQAALREGGRRFDQIYGPLDRDSVRLVGDLAIALAAEGRYDDAGALLRERQARVQERPGPDTDIALRALKARRLQAALLAGDLDEAESHVDAAAAVDPTDAHSVLQAVGRAELARARGRSAEALAALEQALAGLPAAHRQGAAAFELRLALAECRWAAEQRDAAREEFQALLASMKQAQAMRNWTYRRAAESTALALTANGQTPDALALLRAIDDEPQATRVPPPSRAERAESAWRRASVLLAAGQTEAAQPLLAGFQTELDGQHPLSPRRALTTTTPPLRHAQEGASAAAASPATAPHRRHR